MNSALFLLTIIVIVLGFPMVYNYFMIRYRESFVSNNSNSSKSLGSDMGAYPASLSTFFLQDLFPIRPKPGVLDSETASKMWWHYPTFKEGSYRQITNNLKYYNNPDIGRCTPPDLCGTIYRTRKNPSNIVKPLPPVNAKNGTRVGYFVTPRKPFE
jgi:hypothetical protein